MLVAAFRYDVGRQYISLTLLLSAWGFTFYVARLGGSELFIKQMLASLRGETSWTPGPLLTSIQCFSMYAIPLAPIALVATLIRAYRLNNGSKPLLTLEATNETEAKTAFSYMSLLTHVIRKVFELDADLTDNIAEAIADETIALSTEPMADTTLTAIGLSEYNQESKELILIQNVLADLTEQHADSSTAISTSDIDYVTDRIAYWSRRIGIDRDHAQSIAGVFVNYLQNE